MPDFPNRPDRLPDWLEERAVADAVFENAYESLGAEGRARFKHALATLHAFWGERDESRRESRDFRQGFRVDGEDTPAPYALFFCDAEYDRPELLLAALMPAVLAGCPLILPCFIPTKADPATPLLAALELAGVEGAFRLSPLEAAKLLDELGETSKRGRVVVLGRPSVTDVLILDATRRNIPCRELFADSTDFTADAAHEHIRILPDLGPEWFRNRRLRLSTLPEE
jgi:hypothetical protein